MFKFNWPVGCQKCVLRPWLNCSNFPLVIRIEYVISLVQWPFKVNAMISKQFPIQFDMHSIVDKTKHITFYERVLLVYTFTTLCSVVAESWLRLVPTMMPSISSFGTFFLICCTGNTIRNLCLLYSSYFFFLFLSFLLFCNCIETIVSALVYITF